MRAKMIPAIKLPDDLQPWERFEHMAKMLLAVPKEELDRVVAEYEKKRKRKVKRTKS